MEDAQATEQEMTRQPIENIVEIDDSQMFTTSLIIAQAFEKEHKNVLQSIENLECSTKFNELNFQPVEYKDAKGEMGGRIQALFVLGSVQFCASPYRLIRDCFVFLFWRQTRRAVLSRQKPFKAFGRHFRARKAQGLPFLRLSSENVSKAL